MKKIRQQAFGGDQKMLKGGLHCHTTRSDGDGSPEEVIRLFAANGYDFLSLTDHRLYNYKNFAPETDITIIPGMEYNSHRFSGLTDTYRCFHTVSIGPARENGNGFEQDQSFIGAKISGQEDYQPHLDMLLANNNIAILAHPEWSSTPVEYFDKLKGHFAMEIWNTSCVENHNQDKDAPYWDLALDRGLHMYGVASDDSHYMCDHCKGWVMVNADNEISSILNALKSGAFYASTGPTIKDFYVEGDRVHIECSGVSKICLHSAGHPGCVQKSAHDDLTSADFSLSHWSGKYKYVRMTVYTADGKRAWTNPIWLDGKGD